MAFARHSGERVWVSEYKGPAGHTGGIVPMRVEGVACVAVLSYAGLHVARLDAGQLGKTVAIYPWSTDFANNIATPAVHESEVLITSGYNLRLHLGLQPRRDRPLAHYLARGDESLGKTFCLEDLHADHRSRTRVLGLAKAALS